MTFLSERRPAIREQERGEVFPPGDRILWIKTLDAMLELISEGPEAAIVPVRRPTIW